LGEEIKIGEGNFSPAKSACLVATSKVCPWLGRLINNGGDGSYQTTILQEKALNQRITRQD
jgi:hypothetical protein